MTFFKNTLSIIALVAINSMSAKVTDVIKVLDTTRSETIERGMGALTQQTILALQEKAAPIIMSSNILEIILNVKTKLGNDNLQKLRTLIQTSTNTTPIHYFFSQLNISTDQLSAIALISLIDFDNKNFNCYLHKSANLVLVIPKKYIQENLPEAIGLNLNDQAKACGFNPEITTSINDFSVNNLLQKLQIQQSTPTTAEKFITNLTALFTPDKQDTKWAIYLIGHGGPAQSVQGTREQLAQQKKNLEFQQGFSSKSIISYTESNIKRYVEILATSNDTKVIQASSRMAGVSLKEFSELMKFFDKTINTAFLHYATCFSGGYNQIFVNEVLSSLNVNFIASSQGVGEKSTLATLPPLVPNSSKTGLIVSRQPYTDFFKLLNLFIDKPKEFIKIKGEKKEPIAQILRTIIPTMQNDDQPFVRFPGVGVFDALSLDKNIKILTQSIVKAHEIEKRPIDLNDTNTSIIIIKPSRINVLFNLGKTETGHPGIVFPTPKNIPSSYETFHVFKEINFENTLQSLLFNFIHLNARIHTQTFVIKKLTGIFCEKSGLSTKQGTTNTIHNLIIQIKGILGTSLKDPFSPSTPLTAHDIKSDTMGANVEITFELNENIYQCIMGIKNFENPLQNIFETITFTSTPIATMDMNSLANKFLAPQEVTKLKKPITLDSLVQYFDAKIDQQELSLFNQPDADNKALGEFLKREKK